MIDVKTMFCTSLSLNGWMRSFVKVDLEDVWIEKTSLLRQFPKDAWTHVALEWDIKWDEAKEQRVTIIFNDVPIFKLQYFWAVAWDHGRSRTRKGLNGFRSCREPAPRAQGANRWSHWRAKGDQKSSSFLGGCWCMSCKDGVVWVIFISR